MTDDRDPTPDKPREIDPALDGVHWVWRCSNCGDIYRAETAGRCEACGQHLDPRTGLGVVEAHRGTPSFLVSLRNGSIPFGLLLPLLVAAYAIWVLVDGSATFGYSRRHRSSNYIQLVGLTATLWGTLLLLGACTAHVHYFWQRIKSTEPIARIAFVCGLVACFVCLLAFVWQLIHQIFIDNKV